MSSDPALEVVGGYLVPYGARHVTHGGLEPLGRPELNLVVGNDTKSAGFSLTAWYPTGGRWPRHQALYCVRWNNPVESIEEAVIIAVQGLRAYADGAGITLP